MRLSFRFVLSLLAGASALTTVGCNSVPSQWHRQSALVNRRLHGQNQQLAQQQSALDQDRQRLAQENADLQQRLSAANARLDNLNSERQQLQSRYTNLMKNQQSALSQGTTQKFKDLQKIYPDFEFNEETGVSQMGTDFLFDPGSTHINPKGLELISKLAKILNEGEQKHLKMQIVGHTDDRKIVKETTKKLHPTNWHLSTNRANEVLIALSKAGVDSKRMSSGGHGEFRPNQPNTTDAGRKANRRVEMYVFAPDSPIAQFFDDEFNPRSASNNEPEYDPRAAK